MSDFPDPPALGGGAEGSDADKILAYLNLLRDFIFHLPGAGSSVTVGGYEIFQDNDGSLRVRDPDGGVMTLIQKT